MKKSCLPSVILAFFFKEITKCGQKNLHFIIRIKNRLFLKDSGQLNLSCFRITDEIIVNIIFVLNYEDEKFFCSVKNFDQKGGIFRKILFQK